MYGSLQPIGTNAIAERRGSIALAGSPFRTYAGAEQVQRVGVGALDRDGGREVPDRLGRLVLLQGDRAEAVVGRVEHRVHVGHLAALGDLDDRLEVRRCERPGCSRLS